MGYAFETLGNASIQFFDDGRPLLMTDPWLTGTCYYGSWALDHPLDEAQIANARRSPWIWISHGHPDHLHVPSLEMLDKERQTILVPNHYRPEMQDFLTELGFRVEVMTYKDWRELAPGFRIASVETSNQDAYLVVQAGPDLVIDLNDSPTGGEEPWLRDLARRARRSYLMALCSNDADMLNIIDSEGRSLAGPPDMKKPGCVLATADRATEIGTDYFCCSSSQHVYVRRDTIWANPYRITWADMKRWWVSKVELVEPFVTVDLDTGETRRNWPEQTSDFSQITDDNAGDDWSETLSEDEWKELESFFRRFEMLPERLDFVAFTIGDETRRFELRPGVDEIPADRVRGIRFHTPRKSLLDAIRAGYFDELLIGNFMKTELTNVSLYPDFTPIVAKLGCNAKVFDHDDLEAFEEHYRKLSPSGWRRDRRLTFFLSKVKPALRRTARALGVIEPGKRLLRRLRGLPPLPREWKA